MTISLDHDGAQLLISATTPLDRDIVKTISATRAAGSMRWTLPAAVPTYIEAAMVVEREGGTITPAAAEWWAAIEPVLSQVQVLKNAQFPTTTLGGYTLKPAQEQDAQFLAAVGSGLILNEMRTGKSATLFRTLDLLDAFPALIATLPNTTYEIERQCKLAFPDKNIVVVPKKSTALQRKKLIASGADILVVGHNLLELHSKILSYGSLHKVQANGKTKAEMEREKGKYEPKELNEIAWKSISIDEGHSIEKPDAAVTRAAWCLGDSAAHRFVITGTPAANHEDEMWALLRFCYPKLFPSKNLWINRYVNMVMNFVGRKVCRAVDTVGNDGVKRKTGIRPEVRQEWQTIFDMMHVRRTRTDGPDVEHRVIPVELGKEQLKAYQQLAEHSITEIDGELVAAADTMTLRHRLNQLAAGTPVVSNGEVVALQMPSAKIDALFDVLAENEDKAIVVCEGRLFADLVRAQLAEKNVPSVAILGGMTQEEQVAAEREFNTGAAKVILINRAGAFGKELPAAKRTIVLEQSFDLKFAAQARARNTSTAQESSTVDVIDIFALGTLEEAVREAYLNKTELLHERLNDKVWIRQSMYGMHNG